MNAPSPAQLHKQTGGGDAYRVAMLEHGYIYPLSPWMRKPPGSGRAIQCGLTHEPNWSPWQRFNDAGRDYEGRWCRTCATTQARAIPDGESAC